MCHLQRIGNTCNHFRPWVVPTPCSSWIRTLARLAGKPPEFSFFLLWVYQVLQADIPRRVVLYKSESRWYHHGVVAQTVRRSTMAPKQDETKKQQKKATPHTATSGTPTKATSTKKKAKAENAQPPNDKTPGKPKKPRKNADNERQELLIAHGRMVIEQFFRSAGLNPDELLQETDQDELTCWGYLWTEVHVWVYLVHQKTGSQLWVLSPMVYLPEKRREAFYKRCLDINHTLSQCAVSTYNDRVYLSAMRPLEGLELMGLAQLLEHLSSMSQAVASDLHKRFEAPLFKEVPPGNDDDDTLHHGTH